MEEKIISNNRSAGHEYFVLDRIEAGLVLEGGEVKSLRKGNVNLKDSFCVIHNCEMLIKNMHIALYDKSGAFNTKDSKRDRKLLLHKSEIAKIAGKINRQGYTLVPLKMYFKDNLAKVQIAIAKGKELYNKKESLKEKDIKRESDRELKRFKIK